MDEQIVMYLYHELLLSNKKEQITDTWKTRMNIKSVVWVDDITVFHAYPSLVIKL